MTFGVVWRPQAVDEFLRTIHWYDNQRPGLGEEFIAACRTALGVIRSQPELFATVHRSIRRARLKRFPYAIFYLVHAEELVVLGVMHERRDPESWRERR